MNDGLADVPAAERLDAVARLLSEEGFLAEVVTDDAGLHLRLAHCPLRELVEVSRLPCRAELTLVRDLLGSALQRESFIPDGAPSCTYALGQWPKLVRVLDYGDTELDTNWAENSIRPLVLGRKNWLHIGSWEAGPRIAAIASVMESAKRLKVDLRTYLADILPRLATTKVSEVGSLTPAAWLGIVFGPPGARSS